MKKLFTIALTAALATALALPTFAQTGTAPAAAAKAAKTAKAAKPAPTPAPTAQEIADPKAKGLVWVNLYSKVYHSDGEFYGKTKSGKFMTKEDADKAGYKAAQEPKAKKVKAAAKAAKDATK